MSEKFLEYPTTITERGWYHDTEWGNTNSISFHEVGEKVVFYSEHGPFRTFTECKNDAIKSHRFDIQESLMAVYDVQQMRKKK